MVHALRFQILYAFIYSFLRWASCGSVLKVLSLCKIIAFLTTSLQELVSKAKTLHILELLF